MTRLRDATIRDFSGGWNIADNEYNLSSKYQPVSDNVVVGADNAVSVRYGYRRLSQFKNETVDAAVAGTFSFSYTNAAAKVEITITGHPFNSGDHITITGAVTAAGIPVDDLNGTFGVIKVDANTIEIQTRRPATSTTTGNQTISYVRDQHYIAGDIRAIFFFQNLLHVICSEGEIAVLDIDTGVITNIWNTTKAAALSGSPNGWRRATNYSFDTYRQTMLVVNGKDNDKPLEIRHNRPSGAIVQYLVDPATVSNANVYAADLVRSFGGYVILVNPNNTTTSSSNSATVIDISAQSTSGVFVGNAAPDDAVQVDLGIVTSTVDPRITAIGSIRNNVFVAFYDTAMLGRVGIYNGSDHEPEFEDQIPQHGALNNRVLHTIGNDLFMCDYAGVPAFSQSIQSGSIIPERLSMFIDPALNTHLSRLSQDTLRDNVWAIFNVRDRQYMLFVPKHDSASVFTGEPDAIYISADLAAVNRVIVFARNHTVAENDFVVVSGAADITGLAASAINGTRRVHQVIDSNYFVMEVGTTPTNIGINGGGSSISFAPVNDEHIGYIYQYNPQLRIRRWTRFRGLQFDAGCLTNNGRVIFAYQGDVFMFGTVDQPIYADEVDVFDSVWAAGENYVIGDRIKQTTGSKAIYECIVDHTSAGTFSADVLASNKWQVYYGKPIEYDMETPWSDLKARDDIKSIKHLRVDALGSGQFTVEGYSDSYYMDRSTYDRVPAATMRFTGQDSGGFGLGLQPFGGGRNVRTPLQFSFPVRGKLIKFRIHGQTTSPLSIIGITMLYNQGSIYK